ncbi:MAG TPA: trypsin-like peptidase domain-containing protein, partial [Pirellulales bacterium]
SLANEAPRPGDVLTIAGYGSGQYRAASGRCTQYVAPGTKFPFEMVEVAVSARQGDSGGPIFNEQGQLAGVLFGEGHGRTSGSYCGRVRWFLTSVLHTEPAAVIAEAPLRQLPARATEPDPLAPAAVALAPSFKQAAGPGPRGISTGLPEPPTASVSAVVDPTQQDLFAHLGWEDIAGHTLGEQIKSVLAAVGIIAVILQVLHFASRETAKR